MSGIEYKLLEIWCQEVIAVLGRTGVRESIIEMQREAVRSHAGKPALYKMAEDLAEGLSEMPSDVRDAANKLLLQKYGFGYELFTQRKLKRLRTILRKGKIGSDDEFREMSALAGDTEIDAELRRLVDKLLMDYEGLRVRAPKKSSVVAMKKGP